MANMRVGKAAVAYGSGRSTSLKSGYVRVWRPGHPLAGADGYALEHRLVCWENGVDPRGKEVHHRNEDKTDNRWENLKVETSSSHHAEHHPVGAPVKNQHGTFSVLTPEQRREANRTRSRENQRKRRAGLMYDSASGEWFDRQTFAAVGGSGDPAAASPAEQDKRAAILYDRRGSAPWPTCGRA